MKVRSPRYKQLVCFVPEEDPTLQSCYAILWHIANGEFRDVQARNLAICSYLHLIEELLEEHCPPYEGGQKWDNPRRKKL